MKKQILILGMLAGMLAIPATTKAAGGLLGYPFKVQVGGNFFVRINSGHDIGPAGQLGPWYHYWPMEAHFQHRAPLAGYQHNHSYQTMSPQFINNQFNVQPQTAQQHYGGQHYGGQFHFGH